MDRGAWRATVLGIAESDMTEHAELHTSSVILIQVYLPSRTGHSPGTSLGVRPVDAYH